MTSSSIPATSLLERDDPSGPKTTRPPARLRRAPGAMQPVKAIGQRQFDAVPDRIDARDWFYRPGLTPIPDVVVNCDRVPGVLDQGHEGACTGYALAAVINYLLHGLQRPASVSPHMLYEMARRYDEWPGEAYEGSSARGAMKGWVRHGVCSDTLWPKTQTGPDHLTAETAKEAREIPGGAFYRVMHREIRDVHAAIAEVGIVYMTLMVHDGWFEPGPNTAQVTYYSAKSVRTRSFPIIARQGRATAGHAVALVGYTRDGFIVQNSWGEGWGERGYALLPYEDFMLHATDVWVAQLGVPIAVDLWQQGGGYADSSAGLQRAATIIPLADIRPYAIDIGNNGELSRTGDYWTTEQDLARLLSDILPASTDRWSKRRVALYFHGGLNDERAVARRVIAFRDVFLANEIYPLHIMWESGGIEVFKHMLDDLSVRTDARAGGAADWLRKMRDGLLEARDWTLELTTAAPGGAMWREMKENAKLASDHPKGRGGMQLLGKHTRNAMAALDATGRDGWELHVVGHSAGAIYAAHAMSHILETGIPLKTVQFLAPAMTTELFRNTLLPLVKAKRCPLPDLYVLSDTGELDDEVGPYGKSLLYLVSNAFEGRRETPLLGMERFVRRVADSAAAGPVDDELARLFKRSLVVAGEPARASGLQSRSDTHGGFDNDPCTMNSVIRRILGGAPSRPFGLRDLQF